MYAHFRLSATGVIYNYDYLISFQIFFSFFSKIYIIHENVMILDCIIKVKILPVFKTMNVI